MDLILSAAGLLLLVAYLVAPAAEILTRRRR